MRGLAFSLLSWLLVAPIQAQTLEERLDRLEKRITALEEENRTLRSALEQVARAPRNEVSEAPARVVARPEVTDEGELPLPKAIRIGKSRLVPYGFARLDAIYDDSRPNAQQTPTFILSEDRAGGADRDSHAIHPRLTRVGFDLEGPTAANGDFRLGGKLEIDFQNGGRESRQVPRMRHGFLTLDWASTRLLIGQTWDAISPLYPSANADTLMWNAGNLGDRRPQIRIEKQRVAPVGEMSLTVGLGLTGAIDGQDLDGDGVRDGEDATFPHVQARFGFSRSAGSELRLGLWGHYGREELDVPILGQRRFDTHSIGIDAEARFGRAVVRGELWRGTNLSDFRGGIGQGIEATTGREIESQGGWLEVGIDVTPKYFVAVGRTVDAPERDDLREGARLKNHSWFLVQRWKALESFLVGLDYLRWTTEYIGLPEGLDNRLDLYLVYNF